MKIILNLMTLVMNLLAQMTNMTEIPVDVNMDVEDHRNLQHWSKVNGFNESMLPIDMRFNQGHLLSITVYSVLLVISATGNVTVLALLIRRRRRNPTRINIMLMHLAIADLLVTFLIMPLEIAWASTVSWRAGAFMCRTMAFFRTFGLYLSSFVLVCISVDRYYAVLKPLHQMGTDKRGRVMLGIAWSASAIFSIPQIYVFHLENHPNITWYEQCVTYNIFTPFQEILYQAACMLLLYLIPLAIISYSYASILCEIFRRSKECRDGDKMRRSSLGFLGRAKVRTLKMTVTIVLVFFICWTPYYVMSMWYWIDRETAMHVDQRIQRGLFLFACANSCANPIVYGAYNIRAKRQQTQLIVNRVQDRSGSGPRLSSSGAQGLGLNQMNNSLHLGEEFQNRRQFSKNQNSFIREANRRAICLSCGESLDLPSLDGSTRNGVD